MAPQMSSAMSSLSELKMRVASSRPEPTSIDWLWGLENAWPSQRDFQQTLDFKCVLYSPSGICLALELLRSFTYLHLTHPTHVHKYTFNTNSTGIPGSNSWPLLSLRGQGPTVHWSIFRQWQEMKSSKCHWRVGKGTLLRVLHKVTRASVWFEWCPLLTILCWHWIILLHLKVFCLVNVQLCHLLRHLSVTMSTLWITYLFGKHYSMDLEWGNHLNQTGQQGLFCQRTAWVFAGRTRFLGYPSSSLPPCGKSLHKTGALGI